jgi:hypothetical protein
MTDLGDVMAGLFALVLGLAACGGLFALPVGIALWVMRPVDRAARFLRRPTQFTVTDFLCLFFIIQLPMALIHGFLKPQDIGMMRQQDRMMIWLLDIFVWCACGAMWWGSVRTLSRAGIERPLYRSIFLAVVLPITIFATVAAPGLLIGVASGWRSASTSTIALLAGGAVLLVVAVVFCGLYTRWMVARSQIITAEVVAEEDDGVIG